MQADVHQRPVEDMSVIHYRMFSATTEDGIALLRTVKHKCQTARVEAETANHGTIAATAPQKEDIIPA